MTYEALVQAMDDLANREPVLIKLVLHPSVFNRIMELYKKIGEPLPTAITLISNQWVPESIMVKVFADGSIQPVKFR